MATCWAVQYGEWRYVSVSMCFVMCILAPVLEGGSAAIDGRLDLIEETLLSQLGSSRLRQLRVSFGRSTLLESSKVIVVNEFNLNPFSYRASQLTHTRQLNMHWKQEASIMSSVPTVCCRIWAP